MHWRIAKCKNIIFSICCAVLCSAVKNESVTVHSDKFKMKSIRWTTRKKMTKKQKLIRKSNACVIHSIHVIGYTEIYRLFICTNHVSFVFRKAGWCDNRRQRATKSISIVIRTLLYRKTRANRIAPVYRMNLPILSVCSLCGRYWIFHAQTEVAHYKDYWKLKRLFSGMIFFADVKRFFHSAMRFG